LVVEGVAGVDSKDSKHLVPVTETSIETTLTLASAHALVLLDDGVVGDPMEKTTLDALNWKLSTGDKIAPAPDADSSASPSSSPTVTVKRRFQFSSQLKRMSTISNVQLEGKNKVLISVKGAPETLKKMYKDVPEDYEKTYKWFAQRGSRVLALGYKWADNMSAKEVKLHYLPPCYNSLSID
jgi:cation-transporting ATPase 13A1